MATRPATFDRTNRELRTSRFHFSDQPEAVSSIDWKPGIGLGSTVSVGDSLATVSYDDGSTEAIVAPPWCAGSIERLVVPVPTVRLSQVSTRLLSLGRV